MTQAIKRAKVKKVELTAEEQQKIEDEINHLVGRLETPQAVGITYHCEGACGAGCGSEVAGACPPCPLKNY